MFLFGAPIVGERGGAFQWAAEHNLPYVVPLPGLWDESGLDGPLGLAKTPADPKAVSRQVRNITPEQAKAAYDILVRAAGARGEWDDAADFVHHVAHPYDPAREYRFGGALGLGGKFSNDGNLGDTPHVTCYPEDLDAAAASVMRQTNQLLAELFPPTRTGRSGVAVDDRDFGREEALLF